MVKTDGTFLHDRIILIQMFAACFGSWRMQACEPRLTGPASPRKDSTSIVLENYSVLLVWILAPAYARCASVVTTEPNMTYSLPLGERTIQLAAASPSVERVPPSVQQRTSLGIVTSGGNCDEEVASATCSQCSAPILAQEPFPVRTCTVTFPFTSVSGFALSKSPQTRFLCLCASFSF